MRSVQERIEWLVESNGGNCNFFIPLILPEIIAGITAAVGALGATIPAVLTAPLIAGVAATAPLDIGVGAALGAGLGAGEAALTGGKPGLGALTGGISGAAAPFGAPLGEALGIGATAGDVLVGAGTGLIGSEVTGQNPLTGAATGAASGLISGLTAGIGGNAPTTGTTSPAGVGPQASPATVSTPAPSLSGTAGSSAAFGDISSMSGGSIWSGPSAGITSTPLASTGGTISGAAAGGGGISGPSIIQNAGPPLAPGTVAADGGTTTQTPAGAMTPGQATIFSPMATADTPAAGDVYATPAPSGGLLSKFGDIGDWISNNPIKAGEVALAGGGLLYNMLGQKGSAEQQDLNQLQAAATSANTAARAAEAPLLSGVLPPGAQSAFRQSKANQEAAVKSAYISMGMPGGTGQAEAEQAIDMNVAAQQLAMENSLFGEAAGFVGVASQDYQNIIADQQAKDQQFNAALGGFVAALAGATSSKSGTPIPA